MHEIRESVRVLKEKLRVAEIQCSNEIVKWNVRVAVGEGVRRRGGYA